MAGPFRAAYKNAGDGRGLGETVGDGVTAGLAGLSPAPPPYSACEVATKIKPPKPNIISNKANVRNLLFMRYLFPTKFPKNLDCLMLGKL